MEIDRSKISPMMRQYLETKDVYPDTLLFFRSGTSMRCFLTTLLSLQKLLSLL